MRPLIVLLSLLCSFPLLAAPGDLPLSPVLQAPLTNINVAAVATSGSEFLVAFGRHTGVYWQRVALDGSPIDPRARHLGFETTAGYPLGVAWNGSSYLIAWVQGGVLVGQHVGRDGTVFPRFTIADDNPYGIEVLGGRGDVAVLSKGEQTRVRIVDEAGNIVRAWQITQLSPSLARIQDGWRVIVHPYTSGLHLLDPETGTMTMLWPSFPVDQAYASPAGGALAFTRGRDIAVITPWGEFKTISLDHEVDVDWWGPQAYASPAPEGWAFFYRSAGRARVATVLSNGTIASDREIAGDVPIGSYSSRVVAVGTELQRNLVIQRGWPGLESVLVLGADALDTPSYAIGDAAQHSAVIARAPEMDLIVWSEAADGEWTLRATRVVGDRPLDGEGIVVASGSPYPAEAIFNGESFAVVWDQPPGGTFLRRVGVDGTLIDPEPVLLDAEGGVSTIASSGNGDLLVGWQFGGKVAVVRNGTPLPGISLWPEPRMFGFFEAAAFGDSYFVVSVPAIEGCQITCIPDPVPIEARHLARDGGPVGAPFTLGFTDDHESLTEPIAAHGVWFLSMLESKGPEVVRIRSSAPLMTRTPAIRGELRSTGAGIEIVGWAVRQTFRGLLSPELKTLWYEPLPVTAGERLAAVLTSETSILVEQNQRYVLRSVPPAAAADLAIVHRGRRVAGATIVDDVTVEHRGGSPVNAIFVDVWSGGYLTMSASRPMINGRIEGPFLPGESIDLSISGLSDTREARLVIALPDARDVAAADNFLEIGSNGPVRERRRAVNR